VSFSLLAIELKEALQNQRCPVCSLVRDADRRSIRYFLWEGKNEGQMLLRLKRSLGLCQHHARLLVETELAEEKDCLGTTTLYDWLLDLVHETLRDYVARGSFEAAKRRPPLLLQEDPCPICVSRRDYEEVVLWGLQQFLAHEGGRETLRRLYAESGGLCLPHLRDVLRLTRFPEVVELLLEVEERALASLVEELELFQRKHRVEEQAPIGKEGDAWERALDLLAGRLTGPLSQSVEKPEDESRVDARR